MTIQSFHYPKNVEEAVQLLSAGDARAVAGGTSFAIGGLPEYRTLVDLSGLGLGSISEGTEGLRLEACVTLQDLARSDAAREYASGIMNEAASAAANRPLRNVATVGGSITSAFRWSDVTLALLALDAKVVLAPGGEGVPISDFISRPRGQRVPAGNLVISVVVPARARTLKGAFIKMSKVHGDLAMASAAVSIEMDGGACKAASIALGGATVAPVRASGAEGLLAGKPLDERCMDAAAGAAASEVELAQDMRADNDYQRHLLKVLVKRCLEECRGGDGK